MAKIIDREKVIRHIAAEIVIAQTCKKDFASVDIDMLSDALALLKEQEAVKPKTGHWIESKCFDECLWVCSECNFPSEAIAAPKLYNYCPNCGAKMNGGEVG